MVLVAILAGKQEKAIGTADWRLPICSTWAIWAISHAHVAHNFAAHPMCVPSSRPFTIHTKLVHLQQLFHPTNVVKVLTLKVQAQIESTIKQ
jgi:hypothetical protein